MYDEENKVYMGYSDSSAPDGGSYGYSIEIIKSCTLWKSKKIYLKNLKGQHIFILITSDQ